MRRGKRTLSYRAILLMVATLVLLLDIVLAAVIYRHYISPSYSKNLQARMREAFSQVAADPTGSQTALLRENFHVLVLRENGQLVTANVEPARRTWRTCAGLSTGPSSSRCSRRRAAIQKGSSPCWAAAGDITSKSAPSWTRSSPSP